jgi:beta-mannosidase  (EC 3.2.1.25)
MTAGRLFHGLALTIMAIGKRCIIRQKRAFAPVLVDAVKEGEDLNIYVMSDKLEADKEVTLLLRVMDF